MAMLLHLDEEEAQIMLTAADAANAIISARAKRVDPDGALGRSLGMSETKLKRVRSQLQNPYNLDWDELTDKQRDEIFVAAEHLLSCDHELEQAACYSKLVAMMLQSGQKHEADNRTRAERAGPKKNRTTQKAKGKRTRE